MILLIHILFLINILIEGILNSMTLNLLELTKTEDLGQKMVKQ